MEEAREKRKKSHLDGDTIQFGNLIPLKEWKEHCLESICGKYVNYIYFKCPAGRPLPW